MRIFISCLMMMWTIPSAKAQSDLPSKIEDHFRLYLVNDARRSKADQIKVKKNANKQTATMYYWRNLENRNPADVICDAYTWLLQGRTRYGRGAKSAFSKFSNMDAFELLFYDLEFATKRGKKKGHFLPSMKAKQYISVRVSRADLKKVNFRKTWIDKQVKESNCAQLKELFTKVSFDQAYMRKKT